MPLDNVVNVIQILKEKYKDLFEAEKKVAKFIIENPYVAVNCNVAELAEKSGVSDASVVRMCKHSDFSGYYQLRIALSMNIGYALKPNNRKIEDKNAVESLFQEYSESMLKISRNISAEIMKKCVNEVLESNYVHIIVVGNTTPLAQYMGFRLGRLGIKATYFSAEEYWLNAVTLATKEDIVIAISQSGLSRYVIKGAKIAAEKDIKIIAITGNNNSQLAKLANYVLLSSDDSNQFDFFKNYAHLKETAVVDALLYFLTNKEVIEERNASKMEMMLAETKE